ncbi:hypothetical protein ACQKWADRAFT_290348 [Trichoderma austrokoningii]
MTSNTHDNGAFYTHLCSFTFPLSMMITFSEVVYDITDYIYHHFYIVFPDGFSFLTLVTCIGYGLRM